MRQNLAIHDANSGNEQWSLYATLMDSGLDYGTSEPTSTSISQTELTGPHSPISRARRNLSQVIMSPEVRQTLVSNVEEFLHSKEWYMQHCLPWKRGGPHCVREPSHVQRANAVLSHSGLLLHGPPGVSLR